MRSKRLKLSFLFFSSAVLPHYCSCFRFSTNTTLLLLDKLIPVVNVGMLCRDNNDLFLLLSTKEELVDSTYDCKTQQNATLTGQEEEGDVQLKVS